MAGSAEAGAAWVTPAGAADAGAAARDPSEALTAVAASTAEAARVLSIRRVRRVALRAAMILKAPPVGAIPQSTAF
jgi:hypothetical protein